MFNNIAHKYDFLNRVLSFRRDVKWRKQAIELLGIRPNHKVLDLACGTGDMMIELSSTIKNVDLFGGDFSINMLEIARKKQIEYPLIAADAHYLPFKDNSFDRMMIAFGFRNVTDKEKGLKEMCRIIKQGGVLCILEFSQPENPFFAIIYKFYFTKILPFIGGIISGNKKAYEYLPDSVYKFPKKKLYKQMILNAGFSEVRFNPMTFGICDATICIKNKN
jgi:demethylmenaquinone methyltransferase/2-methoxy-6-polyprenyl-1,4-benzoquinol methylase